MQSALHWSTLFHMELHRKADSGLFKSANRENCLPLSHIKLSGAGPLVWRSERPDWTGTSQLVAVSGEVKKLSKHIMWSALNISCWWVCLLQMLHTFSQPAVLLLSPSENEYNTSQQEDSLPNSTCTKFVQPMLFTQRRQFKWTRL